MVAKITEIIDDELSRAGEADGNRVPILGVMADVRGTLGLSLANIRAYLLTGDPKFAEKFDKLWAKNEVRFKDLQPVSTLLNETQFAAFEAFAENRVKFAPLPPKMFDIRGSKKWKIANYLLATEAAPRAGKLLTHPFGALQPDGSRVGGMVANQKQLLSLDAETNRSDTRFLLTGQRILLAVGLILIIAIAVVTARAISKPVVQMTARWVDWPTGMLAQMCRRRGGRMRLARWRTPFRSSKTI